LKKFLYLELIRVFPKKQYPEPFCHWIWAGKMLAQKKKSRRTQLSRIKYKHVSGSSCCLV